MDRRTAADHEQRAAILAMLIAARRDAGLSQRQVARHMGVGQATVSQLEATKVDPRLSTLQRYARALGLRIAISAEPIPDADSPR